jgi:hypothetical protein
MSVLQTKWVMRAGDERKWVFVRKDEITSREMGLI